MDPSELGWCPDSIASLLSFLDDQNSKAFLVLKDGKMVIEHYYGTFTQDSVWYWASAGKSLAAFLVGRAQEEGFLSINDRTSDHLGTGWTSCSSEKEDLITIRHQLTMTTGLNDAAGNADCTTPSCLQYLVDAGTRWAYHNAPYTLTHAVVEAASGVTFNQFTNTYIKQQTGMNGLWWTTNYNDVFYSSPRSMARFGLLMLNNGVWDGDTLMHDQQYLYDMTHPSQSLNESYGYLWWLNGQNTFMIPQSQFVFPGPAMPSAPSDMFAALGKNGQIVSIAPSQGLVIVRMGNDNGSGGLISITLAEDIWNRIDRLSCAVGIDAQAEADEFGMYPNPVTDRLVLTGKAIATGMPLTVMNAMGQQVQVLTVNADHSVNVGHLRSGVYFLRMERENETRTVRFVKE
jgi:CubicO group peptidase (beta-lactamase class C family)